MMLIDKEPYIKVDNESLDQVITVKQKGFKSEDNPKDK